MEKEESRFTNPSNTEIQSQEQEIEQPETNQKEDIGILVAEQNLVAPAMIDSKIEHDEVVIESRPITDG